jgi:hypothetical protein
VTLPEIEMVCAVMDAIEIKTIKTAFFIFSSSIIIELPSGG